MNHRPLTTEEVKLFVTFRPEIDAQLQRMSEATIAGDVVRMGELAAELSMFAFVLGCDFGSALGQETSV